MKSYKTIENMSWAQTRTAVRTDARPPYSVHMPLNLPESRLLVYCDAALNAYTVPVPPDLKTKCPEDHAVIESLRILLVSFAFGEAPFAPDFRLSQLSRPEGGYPLVKARYFAEDIAYELNYRMEPDGLLWIDGKVTNRHIGPKTAVVRCKAGYPRERSVFDYHYISFHWDAACYAHDGGGIVCDGDTLTGPHGAFGRIYPGGFDFNFEESLQFTDADYNKNFTCECPYFVQPGMRITEGRNFMRFAAELQPGESREFTLAFQTEPEKCKTLPGANPVREDMISFWKKYQADTAKIDFGCDKLNDIFRAIQLCNLQLLITEQSQYGEILQPCQGGSSERFYVWLWEAMEMLKPMSPLGYFGQVRRVLEFFFMLQDGGCPPSGEFQSLAGAIGTTGPRWASTTGSALLLATQYLKYSEDREFAGEYLPRMIRAAKWILGEVKATRFPLPDGSRSRFHGLMPKARATDGDSGYIIASTDTWSCRGVMELTAYLKQVDHPEYDELAAECRIYQQDIDEALKLITRADGFIDRKMSDEGKITHKFHTIAGAMNYHYSGLIDAADERMKALVKYQEQHNFCGFFCGPMDQDVMYVITVELAMFLFYLRNGEWKKGWAAAQTLLRYGMSSDLYLAQERFSLTDPAYTPWQPNGSGNGRILDLMIGMLYLENREEILLLGGIAPWDLLERESLSITGLHTSSGKMDLHCMNHRLSASWEYPLPAGTILRLPEHFIVEAEGNVKVTGGGFFELTEAAKEFNCGITVDPAVIYNKNTGEN